MFTAIPLPNLPQIPQDLLNYKFEDLVDYEFKCPCEYPDQQYQKEREVTHNGEIKSAGKYRRMSLEPKPFWSSGPDLEQWLKENIIDDWRDVGISFNDGPLLAPHLDRTRLYTLQYLIDAGGENVQTVFYDVKSNQADFVTHYMHINNYDDLEPIEQFVFKPGEWWLIYGQTYHSVVNIEGTRNAVQIGFLKNPYDKLKDK